MVIPEINCTPTASSAEIFFLERSIELLDPNSIETYRLLLHNPRSLLAELNNAIRDLVSGDISNEEYASLLIDEANLVFKRPTHLRFRTISEEYFKIVLRKKDLNDVFYASNILLLDNERYIKRLLNKIRESISNINKIATPSPVDYEILNDLISFFLVELREIGYSKIYLKRFFVAIFKIQSIGSFTDRLKIVASLIWRPKEKFEVVVGFSIKPSVAQQLQILDPSLLKINSEDVDQIIERTNEKIKSYFATHADNIFYRIEIDSSDYYSASNQVRKSLHIVLDMLFMGYSDQEFSLNPKCVVIGSSEPAKAGVHNLNYQLDGYFKNDQKKYEEFSKRINAIREKGIAADAINRIESALRYLRLGSDVKEVENKLINYWIGMEYFFSSNDSKQSKMWRMREFFKRIHGKIYFKRLLLDFHRNVRMFSLQMNADNKNSLAYLRKASSFEAIERNQVSPLLAFRAYKLREILFDNKRLVEDLQRHVQRVEWNLVRIYRQRNSIVHSASGKSNILDITSHLRYYLIFSINSAVDYMSNSPFDINKDGKLNLEDYFLVNKAEFDNLLVEKSIDISKILSIRNPIEFLT